MTTRAIVCVDDEEFILKTLKEELKRQFGNSYVIEVAQSGEEALEIVEDLQEEGIEIPLIISDQIMPGIKGDELLIQLHSQYPKMLKIMLTGQASGAAVGNAVNRANLYRYMAKPWDETDLVLTVTEALGRYDRDRQLDQQNQELQKINAQLSQLNASLEEKVAQRTAQLAQAEAELRGIFEAMTELILVFDAQGKFTKIVSNNPSLLGQPSEMLLGKTLHNVFEQEQADTLLGYIQESLNHQKLVSVEYRFNRGERYLWFAANISPISTDAVIWVARDVTERKLLEEKLRTSEEKIRALFEAMKDIVLVINWQGEIEIAPTNPRCWDNPKMDPLSQTIEQFWREETGEIWLSKVRQALDTQQTVNFDYSLPIGERQVWFSASISPMQNHAAIWVARDISDRFLAEEALRQSEERWQLALKGNHDGIWDWNLKTREIFYSTRWKEMLGYAEEELENSFATWREHLHPEDRQRVIASYKDHLAQKTPCYIAEYRMRCQDGSYKWILNRGQALWDEAGRAIRIVGSHTDISDQKLAEAAMQAAKEAAEAASLAKSTFLANMSHELRSPLNVILGFCQLMTRSGQLNPEQQENLGIMTRSGEHLLNLINTVLDLSKIEAGRTTLNETNFDLYRLLDDLDDMFQSIAEEKGLQLVFSRSNEVPQYVRTDPVKLRQVLINLISNALKFTQEGSVTVKIQNSVTRDQLLITNNRFHARRAVQPTTLTFEVADTGIGISPTEIDSIFDAFVQAETGRDFQEGTGLGLSIAHKFVQLMGGEISVSSELGLGTTFHFEIHISTVDAVDIPGQKPTHRVIALKPDQPTYRILIVDDKWSNRQLLVRLLAPLGFVVQEASNGQEAVQIWQTFAPQLIWMDMRMPVMDGYEATKQIKTHLKGQATAIIALTASTLEEERAVILSAGCDDFVRKPFREEILFEKMAQYLGVEYIYADAEPSTAQNYPAHPIELTPQDLAVMPAEWVRELYQAADSVDNERILQLIEQIPASSATLAQALADWVKNFRCDRIINLIEKAG